MNRFFYFSVLVRFLPRFLKARIFENMLVDGYAGVRKCVLHVCMFRISDGDGLTRSSRNMFSDATHAISADPVVRFI